MACSVCCGYAGGLPANPSGCPCCNDDRYDEFGEEEEDREGMTETSKVVIARAPRSEAGRKRRAVNGIRVGDKIRVTSGFSYLRDGPRVGYFRREELVELGPAWSDDEKAHRRLEATVLRHGIWSLTQRKIDLVAEVEAHEARTGLTVKWAARDRVVASIASDLEKARLREEDETEWKVVRAASVGDEVTFRGVRYVKGASRIKTVYHSNAEYMGHLCDASCHSGYDLTPVADGKTLTIREGRMPYRS